MIQYSDELLDQTVAPGISKFTAAPIPAVATEFPQAEHWLANLFLNALFGARYKHGSRQVVVAFLRRAQDALSAYTEADTRTQAFLEKAKPGNPGVSRYYAAVASWEAFVLQCAMAMDLFRWLNKGQGAFQKNDGSVEYRLYTIANQVKHTANCIQSGQCQPDHTVPLWLSNEGLQSFGLSVSFAEAAQVLRDICQAADQLENPDAFIASIQAPK